MKRIFIIFFILMLSVPVFAESDFDSFSFESAVQSFSEGKSVLSAGEIWSEAWKVIISEVRKNIGVMITVFGLCAFYAIISSLDLGFGKKNISQTAFFVLYMTVVGLCLTSFRCIAEEGANLIETLTLTQNTVIPLMGTAIISSGNFSVYSSLMPVILLMSNIASNVVRLIGMPAIFTSLAVSTAGNISPDFQLGAIASLIRKTAFWIVTVTMTVFCALVSISGIGSGAISGAATKAIKFAAGSSVPILGSVLSDSIEAVAGSAAVLKSALGAAGMISLFVCAVFPILKMSAVVLMYKLTAALSGIFSDKRITNILSDMADSLSAVIGFGISVSVAMIISTAILVNASNAGVI